MRKTDDLSLLVTAWLVVLLLPAGVSAQSTLRVAWDPNTDSNTAGYQVTYVPQAGGTSRTIDVGAATSATVTGLDLGRWYNFSVRAYNSVRVLSAASPTISAYTTLLTGVASSKTYPIAPGSAVTWTARAASGSPALEYQWWMLSGGSWQMVRDWSGQYTYTWTPGMPDVGTHSVQVWARQAGATAKYESWAGTGNFDVATKPFRITALIPNGRSPFTTGQAVQWSAIVNPSDVADALEYEFWLLDPSTGAWTNVRPYARDNTYTFAPPWDGAGNYSIQVWARYAGTTVKYAAWSGASFRVDRGIGTFYADKVFPVPPGTPVTWTADAGSSSSLEYSFYLYSNGAWQLAQDYSATNTFTWTPGSSDLGTHSVQVWVKEATSTAKYDAWKGTGYFAVSSTPPDIISATFTAAPRSGSATTITATASGGYAGPIEYRFWIYSNATATWTMIQDYSSSNTAAWTPPAAGTYSLQVWVRSAGSTANYEDWIGVSPVIVP